jgi:hypothetical protein
MIFREFTEHTFHFLIAADTNDLEIDDDTIL